MEETKWLAVIIEQAWKASPVFAAVISFATLLGFLVRRGLLDLFVQNKGVDIQSQFHEQMASIKADADRVRDENTRQNRRIEGLETKVTEHGESIAVLNAIQNERKPK